MKYVTSSEVGDWDQCLRKWWIKHHLKLGPEEPAKGAAYVGEIVHDALDDFYADRGGEGDVLAVLRERLDAAIEAQDVGEAKAVEQALVMVEGYFEWLAETGEDQDWEVISSEEALMVPLTEDATALAKLDLRMRRRSSGFVGLVDHKTTGDLVELETGAHFRPQFVHYLFVAGRVLGARVDGLVVNGIKRSKRTARATPPFFVRFTIRHNPMAVLSYEQHLRAKVKGMLKAHRRLDDGESHHDVVPPSPRPECTRTCEFARICPLIDSWTEAETALELEMSFTRTEPLQRYEGLLP